MEIFKLFDENIINDNESSNFQLSQNVATFIFSLVWTKPERCSLYFLISRLKNGTWHNIITHPISDNDGETSIKIGDFVVGTEIEIAFGVQAITKIPKMAVLLINQSTKKVLKFKPEGADFKELDISETWNENSNVTLL
jgi:hypothetical protein